jgi:DNA-binding transcriptional LysR family regulator
VAGYTLRQLEYFVAVAEVGTVTGAAARIHLSQSALSTALSDLERTLDVQLLVRHHARGVTLTSAGDQLLGVARRLLADADDLQAAAQELGGGLGGGLALGCFSVLAPYVLPALHAATAREHPQLRLETTDEQLNELQAGVLDGRLELALGYDLGLDPRLDRVPLFSVSPYVLLPARHRLAGNPAVRLADLADEPLVLLDLPHSREYFQRIFSAAQVTPSVRYRTASVELARALVGRGLGYTVLNLRPAVDQTLDGHPVSPVALADPTPALDVVLLRHAAGRHTRRAEAITRLAVEVFAGAGGQRAASPAGMSPVA